MTRSTLTPVQPDLHLPPLVRPGEDRTARFLKEALLNHLRYTLIKDPQAAAPRDYYHALVRVVRDCLASGWLRTERHHQEEDHKRVYYLSAEFLLGRLLDSNLINLGLYEPCQQALAELHCDLEELIGLEWDAGLGAGGLGRLAACYLDSMATLGLAGYGYGIRYEYGTFYQNIENGYQVETPDNWLRYGNPWEISRPDCLYPVHFRGRTRQSRDAEGRLRHDWIEAETVMAMACDLPIAGYGNDAVNTFRTWMARASREFDLECFNYGEYVRAVEDKNRSENLARVLYPKDDMDPGRELRLKQEYFLVSASLQDIVRRYRSAHGTFDQFPEKVAIQLNDTHPALAIPELMRLLLDQEGLTWEQAWAIAVPTFGYTNHTILPEALERWPVDLLARVLPRHLEIIYEINRRFLSEVAQRYPGDTARLRRVSLVEEGTDKQVRMAHLAIVGSHALNGVSALHSRLLAARVFADFHDLYPERFSNKTNGITPRLWLLRANPGLAELISTRIGSGWITDLSRLEQLVPLATDPDFQAAWEHIKRANKESLASEIDHVLSVRVDPDSLFACQIKRIHEYKRQLLNVLHVIALYNRLRDTPQSACVPRTFVFAGKAAPGYRMAKLILKLITAVADVVNRDAHLGGCLKVIFLPNYRVSLATRIIPAADLSVQISTAGTEASGTSNMKFALNGALTVGTLDGATVEIREAVGAEQMLTFGLTAADVERLRHTGYSPWEPYHRQPELRRALDMIRDGYFAAGQRGLFQPLLDSLFVDGDPYFVLADFAGYVAAQELAAEWYRDRFEWTRKSILTVARMGKFSSDRAVQEYAEDIWGVR